MTMDRLSALDTLLLLNIYLRLEHDMRVEIDSGTRQATGLGEINS